MFDQTSRYYKLKTLSYQKRREAKDRIDHQNIIVYKERRFLPPLKNITILQEVTIKVGERIDNIAYNSIGDPEQFWRICDANEEMHPLEMTSEPGKMLRIGIQRI